MSMVQEQTPSLVSAWWALVGMSFRRMWWSLQTLIAVMLLTLIAVLVLMHSMWTWNTEGHWGWTCLGFSRTILLNLYLGFLLPLLCLSFATQSLGGEWEDRTLVWLLTRPLPRPWMYLGKFLAALPWTLGLAVGGIWLLGLMAGTEGLRSVSYFWPAIALCSLAYLGLFHLLGATFRRSTVIGVVYAFVLEMLVANMPGLIKRASIAFYGRCLVYDLAAVHGLDQPQGRRRGLVADMGSLFFPVDGTTAVIVLLAMTLAFFVIGLIVFTRREYRDLT